MCYPNIISIIQRNPESVFASTAGTIQAFNFTSRYLDDLLNIDTPYFEGIVGQIYPPESQLNKTTASDTEAPFLDFYLSISN